MDHQPSYIDLFHSGELARRIEYFEKVYQACTLCPHHCKNNRFTTFNGFCRSSDRAKVASYNAHFGEEPPLVGSKGSGTVFFSACNLRCIYCQNYEVSHLIVGNEISEQQLAKTMLNLQNQGCHNINFVSPTHSVLPILKALEIAVEMGLNVPLVYNTGGYDSLQTLKMLEGVFDIYMPDIKYAEQDTGERLSEAENYPLVSQKAVSEMYRQVGNLQVDNNGIAYKGLLVRHLVLPSFINESKQVVDFVASLSKNIYLNIMPQYRPEYKSYECKKINRNLSVKEYNEVVNYAKQKGMKLDSM